MVSFAGWEMPIQYTSIITEHLQTRSCAGLFDVSHMGEITLEGKGATEFLDFLTCNTIASISPNQVQYNAVLNRKGGVVDDVTVYRLDEEKYFICSNANCYQKVYEHFLHYNSNPSVHIRNESDIWHQLAIQGPMAEEFLSEYMNRDLSNIGYFRFEKIEDSSGNVMILSRTGYTGEDGFEIYSSIPTGIQIWKEILRIYREKGLVPAGLGARDTLRLEAKYPLYGHELSEDRTPVESGIGWIVKEKLKPYLGYERIMKDKKEGSRKTTIGIELCDTGVIREEYPVLSVEGVVIGKTTSGTYSPSLKKSIGIAILNSEFAEDGKNVLVEIRGTPKKAVLVQGPFVQGSVRKMKKEV